MAMADMNALRFDKISKLTFIWSTKHGEYLEICNFSFDLKRHGSITNEETNIPYDVFILDCLHKDVDQKDVPFVIPVVESDCDSSVSIFNKFHLFKDVVQATCNKQVMISCSFHTAIWDWIRQYKNMDASRKQEVFVADKVGFVRSKTHKGRVYVCGKIFWRI
jgi:hypothetical protein